MAVTWEVHEWYDSDTGWMVSYHKSEGEAQEKFSVLSGRRARLVKVETIVQKRVVDKWEPEQQPAK